MKQEKENRSEFDRVPFGGQASGKNKGKNKSKKIFPSFKKRPISFFWH